MVSEHILNSFGCLDTVIAASREVQMHGSTSWRKDIHVPDPTAFQTHHAHFTWLMQQAGLVLLQVDRPYLAACLQQFQTMAEAVWPDESQQPPLPLPLRR
jgi:hypothetical protein